jgi:nickel-dependent lactate racemase
VYCGDVHEAWRQAAALSSRRHIVWVEKPFDRVLAVMPPMYDDLWVAAKGTYKTEPAVADGGEVVIYAPHVREVSHVHGRMIEEIGYHCRDYFLAQWARDRCNRINLGYRNPAEVDQDDWAYGDGSLLVPRAGEMLFRVGPAPVAP